MELFTKGVAELLLLVTPTCTGKRFFVVHGATSLLLNCVETLPGNCLYSLSEYNVPNGGFYSKSFRKDHWEDVLCEQMSPRGRVWFRMKMYSAKALCVAKWQILDKKKEWMRSRDDGHCGFFLNLQIYYNYRMFLLVSSLMSKKLWCWTLPWHHTEQRTRL